MPLLFSLNMDAPIKAMIKAPTGTNLMLTKTLPSCQSEGNPAKYEPIAVAE